MFVVRQLDSLSLQLQNSHSASSLINTPPNTFHFLLIDMKLAYLYVLPPI